MLHKWWAFVPAWLAAVVSSSFVAQAADKGRFVEYEHVAATGLTEQRLTIWLPPGYDRATRRYPVVYMHDAQNLFDPTKSGFNKVWAADKAMLAVMATGKVEPHIIVGIWAPGAARYRQYLPLDVYLATPAELRTQMDAMAGGPIASEAYLTWLSGPLKRWVDRKFRTKTSRDDTTIIGSSMGGLMSCYAFLKRPRVYGRAGCVSSHWPAIDPRTVDIQNPAMTAIWDHWFASHLGTPNGRRLWMDHGTETLDAFYAPYQQVVDTRLAVSGWQKGTDWESRVYAGAAHEENSWATRLPEIFIWLLEDRVTIGN
ncbi:alpha/beta hydrolase [Sphingorhabdus sp.]|uniref:alpha/beta hydrolase n=2 Tax=Sphingorhabdus sp. TaxID=1902408 RepID=UPI003BAFEA9E|nr:alpha/beta hydrolase [Sphingomonadales bacterium]MBK9431825.1 alpha/beta hydrolase [Sphingomonadales bacterium]MBL0022897.1 alpha/beta hydrolase [Sphingomonadales bacterium]